MAVSNDAALNGTKLQTGIGKGPSLVIHDGFQGLGPWKGFMTGADVRYIPFS